MKFTQRTPLIVNNCLQSKSIQISAYVSPSSYFLKSKEPNTPHFFIQRSSTRSVQKTITSDSCETEKRPHSRGQQCHHIEKMEKVGNGEQPTEQELLNTIKFKRFSRILKQKYLFFNQQMVLSSDTTARKNIKPQPSGKHHKHRTFQNQLSRKCLKQRKIFVGVDKLPSKLLFKQRPSSGVPLKHRSQLLKPKNKAKLNSNSMSVEMKHIQALTYTDGLFSTQSSKLYSPPKQRNPQLKRYAKREERRRNSLGNPPDDCICIDPWDAGERSKNVSELDIKVKLPL